MSRYTYTPPESPERKRRARRKPSSAVLYLRCSNIGQDTFAEQEDKARAKAASQLLYVTGVFRETASASGAKIWPRPDLTQAILLAQSQNAAIIVARIDRLSRNLDDVPKLLATGVTFYSADKVRALPSGVLTSGVRKAELETLRKAQAQKLQNMQRRLSGRRSRRRVNPTAAASGRLHNVLRRDDNIRAAAQLLSQDPTWRSLTHADRARALENAGFRRVMNTAGTRVSDWNRRSVKASWPLLRDEIELILSPD